MTDPLWMQNLSYDAGEDRQFIAAVFQDGVVGPTDLKVVQRAAGTNMSVDVGAGTVAIPGTDGLEQGTYLHRYDAVTNVVLDPAPSVGTTRYDLIVAEVRDAQVNLGANNDGRIRAVAGTAASSPVEPAVPASSVVLARVTVAHNTAAIVTSMIQDRRYPAHDFSVAASGTMTRSRPRNVVWQSNTQRLVHGNVDGTWTDLAASQAELVAAVGPVFGSAPPVGSTVFKEAVFSQLVGAIDGRGNIVLPYTFAGILHFAVMPQLNSTPLLVGHRTDGGAVTTGSNLPVTIFNVDGGGVLRLSGSVVLFVRVLGW